MSIADPNKTILTGENPFVRLSPKDGEPNSTDASYWRIIFSPAGPGHVLYLKSELTEGRWRIYSDNIAMARWLQSTVQGMLNAELSDTAIPCADAQFSKAGDPRYFWTEHVKSHAEEISLTWFDIGEPLLIHSQPNQIPDRRYGVCTVLMPALGTRLVRNGVEATGRSWPPSTVRCARQPGAPGRGSCSSTASTCTAALRTRRSTSLLSSFMFGMPYISRPPIRSARSKTRTL